MSKFRQKPFIKIFVIFFMRRESVEAKHKVSFFAATRAPRAGKSMPTPWPHPQAFWGPIRLQSHDGEKSCDWWASQLLPPHCLYTDVSDIHRCPIGAARQLGTGPTAPPPPPSWRRQVTEVCCVAAAAAAEHESRCASLICS